MVGVLGVAGDASALATLFSFADTYFPSKEPDSAIVRITAGLEGWKGPDNDQDPLEDPQGGISTVKLFNNNHEMIGSSGGGDVDSGVHLDIKVSQVNAQQGYYAQIFGTDNSICIPHVTITWASGEKYGWMGDFGDPCGFDWYYSGRAVDEGSHEPLCTWVGFNQDSGTVPDTIEIIFPRFAKEQDDKNPAQYCGNGLRGWKDGNDITQGPDDMGGNSKRNANRKRAPHTDQRLVVSSFAEHDATKLCESETSRGPDFVSLSEGLFCDMDTREVMPLCGDDIETECFHLDRNQHVKRDGVTDKNYAKILEWGV